MPLAQSQSHTNAVQEGFILTRQQIERNHQTLLEFWFKTDSGAQRVLTPAQQFVLFITQADAAQAEKVLQHEGIRSEIKPIDLKTFQHESVCAIYLNSNQQLFAVRDALTKIDILYFEDDIRLADRYLMERFVYASAQFTGTEQLNRKNNSHTLVNAKLKPGHYHPNFSVLSLDIECSEYGDLYSVGLAADDYQCVIMIGDGTQTENSNAPDWLKWVNNEADLLRAMVAEINQYDPDIIVGWSVVNFDFRLLVKRAEKQNIALKIGRGNTQARWREPKGSKGNDGDGQGFIVIPGRVVIDGIDALKTATYHFDSFSLESVSQELLGKGKKIENVHDRMEHINHDFKHNKIKLAEYNLQDCVLVLEIFEHTKLIEFLILRSQLTGLELDRIGGSVAAFTNLYLPKLHRAGYIAPNRPPDGGLASPGGYVMDSRPGLYKHVLVLDFKSLYPSIIRTFKIDPLGLIEGLANPDASIPGFKGAMFDREKHFLPDIITSLWQQRDQAKKDKDAARSQAIKILMNSFYGVLGSGGCRFYDTRLASSITMRGHSIMQTTAKWIEAQGHQVIYGDTDSTFVWLDGDYTVESAYEVGSKLAEHINQRWHETLRTEFDLDCHLEIEFETYFSQFLMPTIRGAETGSKKRYAGLKATKNGEELVFKGLETVRSDWTELAKEFQQQLYGMIFNGDSVSDYILNIVNQTRNGELDDKLVYKKRLRQPLDLYVKNVPPHVKAARLADAKNKELGRPLQYQNKGWISYVFTVNGAEPEEYRTSPIDYDHYVEKQLAPVADAILPFIGLSFDKVTSLQMGLF
ncbi:DNA polymerase II [Paraneptunicella aestuarii]|uniref:DNA polymerase II n=1 Tax=Paraneptunicella aestuarii TaxID=2831148 RepID=UPI001E4FFDDA|nr:DNA polymerase II [Paraneptunicella aestuarii]UAA38989.1 DNA polymerase II [Paraneptunicella aestuarii]